MYLKASTIHVGSPLAFRIYSLIADAREKIGSSVAVAVNVGVVVGGAALTTTTHDAVVVVWDLLGTCLGRDRPRPYRTG